MDDEATRRIHRLSGEGNVGSPDPLELLWDEVDRDWGDPERHRGFLGLANALGRLADAAKRYRATAQLPERAETSRQQLDRILALAMQSMVQAKAPPDERPRRIVTWAGYLLALGLIGWVTWVLVRG